MNSQKQNRRDRLGDKSGVSKSNTTEAGAIPAQPLPGMPQGPGNMMNDPNNARSLSGMEGGMPGQTLSGQPQSPYKDPVLSPDAFSKMGSMVGIATPSGMPGNMVNGIRLNQNSAFQQQPNDDSLVRMDSMYQFQEAANLAGKAYGQQPAPFKLSPMGVAGQDIQETLQTGRNNPGAYPSNMNAQSGGTLGLQGMPDAQAAVGMNTGRGGGRNQTKGAK